VYAEEWFGQVGCCRPMRLPLACLVVAACDAGLPPPKPTVAVPAPLLIPVDAMTHDDDVVRPPTKDDLEQYTRDLPGSGTLVAAIETNQGTLHCDLLADKAPLAVANFIGLATGKKAWLDPQTNIVEHGKRFYDGLTFHRVIPEFMIQGGDPMGRGVGGPGYTFANEIAQGTAMEPGALAMANAGLGPNGSGTNGSQFFVMEGSRPDLVARHTIFGQCHELDVVKKIARVPRDEMDKPSTAVTITRVSFTRPMRR